MNKKAILASLFVAASSTAALADPYIVQGGATVQATVAPTATVLPAAPTPSVVVRDHRDGDDNDRRDVDGQFMRDHRKLPLWSVLSSADRLSNGRSVIRLGASWKKYSELKLEATRGSFDISRVKITFANGQSTVLKTDGDLTPGSAPLTINLDGNRSISSITVWGKSSRRAQFEILGA